MPPRRRASTTAPTAAISSRNDATSNGSRKRVSSSSPICAGEPKPAVERGAVGVDRLQARAERRDAQLDEQRRAEQRGDEPQAASGARAERLVLAADVGDDEDVEHHHGARVDDDLGRRDELRAQQQEQRRERQQVADEREHAVERVADRDDPNRPRNRPDSSQEEQHLRHEARNLSSRASRPLPGTRSPPVRAAGEAQSGSRDTTSVCAKPLALDPAPIVPSNVALHPPAPDGRRGEAESAPARLTRAAAAGGRNSQPASGSKRWIVTVTGPLTAGRTRTATRAPAPSVVRRSMPTDVRVSSRETRRSL